MIPQKIHQIWLGGKPPPRIASLMDSVRRNHPDWSYLLWTDDNLPSMVNEMEYMLAPSYAMKADLLRYELLSVHGGVYVDADFECHRSLDPLIKGRGGLLLVSEFGTVTNSVMGCVPDHPLVRELVQTSAQRIRDSDARFLKEKPHQVTGPYLVDELYIKNGYAVSEPESLLPGDFFFTPRTRVQPALKRAMGKRYMTHSGDASWRKVSTISLLKRTRLRTRIRRFADLSAE